MHSYLTENQFFAPISVIQCAHRSGQITLEANENYQKRSFRNRCIIDSAQGPITLSVPLAKGKNEQMPIKEVKISYEDNWTRLHLQTIRSSYGNAPYFDHLFEDLQNLLSVKEIFLFDLNIKILHWVVDFMDLDTKITLTESYQKEYPNSFIDDNRNILKPNNYQSVQGLDEPYAQVFEEQHPFINNLSVLDLLFCTGKASLTYLS